MGKRKYPNNCDECDNQPKLLDRIKKIVDFIKPFSIALICVILSFGTVAFFIVSLCINSVTMDTLNGFISIVLGIVALTTSIVSMFLSFYSLEKSDESDKELKLMLQEMKNIQTSTQILVSKIDKKQDKLYEDSTKTIGTSVKKDSNSWERSEGNG